MSVLFSHAFSDELKTVSIVNEAVKNRVAERGIPDYVVPVFHGDLAGDDGRCATMAIVEDLQEVAALGRGENRQAPVVVCGRPLMASSFLTLRTIGRLRSYVRPHWCGNYVRGP